MKKRILSILLAALMLFSLLPTMAFAAGTETNVYDASLDPDYWIQNNSYGLLNDMCKYEANSDHTPIIYYGTDMSGNPMPYYLIGSGYDESPNRSSPGYIVLLAKNCVSESYFDNLRGTKSADYVGSALQTATNAMENHLSDYEKAVVFKYQENLSASPYSASEPYSNGVASTNLTNSILRPLTTAEAAKLDDSIRNIGEDYWLCSPGDSANKAAYVDDSGNVVAAGSAVDETQRGVRPLLIISADYISSISFAVGGKDEKAFLQDTAAENPTNEWKLTISDASAAYVSEHIEITGSSADFDRFTYTFDLKESPEGKHVVLNLHNTLYMDAGTISKAENQVSFLLPPFPGAVGNISVFYEQWNGDKKTDVALTTMRENTNLPARDHVELRYNKIYMRPGNETTIDIKHPYNGGTGTTADLSSSDPTVVTAVVKEQGSDFGYGTGSVTAVGIGKATITLTCANGRTDTCEVTVAEPSSVDYSVNGISTVEEFEDFALQTRLGEFYIGKTVELKADIGSESGQKVTLGLGSFYGTLKGNGHTVWADISDKERPGLCAHNFGTIRDLTVCGRVVMSGFYGSSNCCGAVAAENHGTVYNCTNCAMVSWIFWNGLDIGDYADVFLGGIAGRNYGLVDGCVNKGRVVVPYAAKAYIGGVAGYQETSSGLIKNSVNAGTVEKVVNVYDSYVAAICPDSMFGAVHNCINVQPNIDLITTYNMGDTGPVWNCYSPEPGNTSPCFGGYSCFYHSQENSHTGDSRYSYISPEKVSARSGADALVTLLNSYKGPKTEAYPEDWMTWAFQGDNDYPTPVVGSEQNTETVLYLDENGRQRAVEAKIFSKNTLDTVLYDSGSHVFVVEGELDLNTLLDADTLYYLDPRYMYDCILILKDGSKLTLPKGIGNKSFPTTSGVTVYAQSTGEQAGDLVLSSGNGWGVPTFESEYLTINGGKVSVAGGLYDVAVLAYALTVNGGELSITAQENNPLVANINSLGWKQGKMPNFEACHITLAENYGAKVSKNGDDYPLTVATWEAQLSPVGADTYPASVWFGPKVAPDPKTEVSFDESYTVNGGNPFAYGDLNMDNLPTVSVDGGALNPQPELVCIYYKNDGTTEAPVKGKLLTSSPTELGNYIVEFMVSAADANYTGSKALPFSITQKVLTIKPNDKSAKVGDAKPVLGADDFTVTGLVGDDTLTTKPTLAYESEPNMSQAGTVKIKASGAAAGSNYSISYVDGTLTIGDTSSTEGGGGASSYAIELPANVKNGKVDVSPKSAYAGQTVTLTVTPDKGFTLETLTVLDKNGKEVEIKNLGNNKYSFRMPNGKVSISATFMEDNTMLNFCVDVTASDYYYDAVLWAYENEICKGTDAVHFSPSAPVSRAQVVTFLWRAAGCPEPVGNSDKFTDLLADQYYIKAVAWAIEQGITKGITDMTFEPETVCTRGQIVTFLARFAGVEDADTVSVFSDVPANEFFAAAVKWAKDNGVTSGVTNTTFEPYTNCNRAQVVTFLYRWMVK